MAQNDFQPYAIAATANVTPLANWLAGNVLSNGQIAGYAKSADNNRAVRQPSFLATGIAEWVNQQLLTVPILDDGNWQEWINNFDAALRKLILSYIRIKATGAINVYVSGISGNDANSGASTASPFRTIQKGINYCLDNLDLGPNPCTLFVEGNHTYNEGIMIGGSPMGLTGLGQWQMQSYNGLVSMVGPSGYAINISGGAQFVLNGNFQLSCISTSVGPNGVICSISGSRFGILGNGLIIGNSPGCIHLYAASGGEINNANGQGQYSIAGGGTYHYYAAQNGIMTMQMQGIYGPVAINLTNTPNFTSAFCGAYQGGAVTAAGVTFTGTGATGYKYTAAMNGTINTTGAGAGYFPGDTAGVVGSGGQYI